MSNKGTGTKELDAADSEYFCVEKDTRLFESRIWPLLEEYYQKASISAWNQIPFYPTSNPFIADVYADIILSCINDLGPLLNPREPLYILEMAAGSGCFSFYLLNELKKRQSYFARLKGLQLRYIMADFTEDNSLSWRQNPRFKPFLDEGMLQFGIFRPQDDLTVRKCPAVANGGGAAGEILLSRGSSSNPLIAIANYFFDSMKQDAFQIQNGKLKEARHSFSCKRDSENPEAIKFEALQKSESYHDVASDYFEDARMNNVLASYRREFENASVLFPTGAFQCIANLLEISSGKLVLISSDKGFTDRTYVKGLREQPFVAHHGIFSYSVNYDAIRRYFEALGGSSLNTSDDNLSVSTAVNILLSGSDCPLEHLQYTFAEKVDRQNLINYLYFMQDLLTEVEPKKSNEILRACLGFVQMCNYDPIVFCLCAPRIYASLETMNAFQERRLLTLLRRVRDNFYSVQQQYDVFYWVGRSYYGMNRLEEALKAFADSLLTFGESSSTLYYMAACYEVKQDYNTALRYYQDTLRLEPGCEYTLSGIKRVEETLKGKS
jgi:tetratricopeptide (TPR) repeat protein